MNPRRQRDVAFARLLSSAVVSQALLSAASLGVGLVLIRRSIDAEYGAYVLAINATLLLVSLQNAFFAPTLAARLARLELAGRAAFVGALLRAQHRLSWAAGLVGLAGVAILWASGAVQARTALLVIATLLAAAALLQREVLRLVLLAHRRPQDVLRTDLVYVALWLAGAWAATLTPHAAMAAVLALAFAARVSAWRLARALRRHEAWTRQHAHGLLRELVPLAAWSTAGAAVHWTFSQGYIFLVAGALDVRAVAAIAATRLLLMPVNLLSSGIGSLMLPLAARWLVQHGAGLLWRRLCGFAASLAVIALVYFGVVWLARDWIFANVLQKDFAERDTLLLLWGVVFLLMVVRDQLVYLLAAQSRFRALTLLTFAGALVSLAACAVGLQQIGVTGALMGLAVGEAISLVGVVVLSLRPPAAPWTEPSASRTA